MNIEWISWILGVMSQKLHSFAISEILTLRQDEVSA